MAKSKKTGSDYYDGGYRFVRNGVPCRMAAHVAELTQFGRDRLLRHNEGFTPSAARAAVLETTRFCETTYDLFEKETQIAA